MLKNLPSSNQTMSVNALKDTNPLVLSFVGDGVHTLFIRTALTVSSPYRNNELHSLTSKYVCASAQAAAMKVWEPCLTEDEDFIYRKAKNAHANNIPKHALLMDYKYATAFEAVIGYLYLSGSDERLEQLLSMIYNDENGFPNQ